MVELCRAFVCSGYVYAYAYGQLLALSIYRQYELRGQELAPLLVEMLAAGGSRSPAELGKMVGVDLDDPAFWMVASTSLTAMSPPHSKLHTRPAI